MMKGHPRFYELLDEMAATHEKKNAGYAGASDDPLANFRISERLGIPASKGCLVRWSDKVERVFNLVDDPENDKVNESLKDTLLDLANYCLIALILIEEEE